MARKVKLSIGMALIVITTLLCVFFPFRSYWNSEIFNFYIHSKQVYEGFLFWCIAMLCAAICAVFLKTNGYAIIVFIFAIYLSMNAVLPSAVVALIYIEILCFIGHVVLRKRAEDEPLQLASCFVAGISVWGAGAIMLSIFGYGTINCLRIWVLLLLAICLVMNKGSVYTTTIKRGEYFFEKISGHPIAKILFVVNLFIIAMACAKSNIAIEHDSIWYGLRPDNVLIGPNSFYDFMGYTGFVYYYPKMMELLFLPISELGSYSIVICANIAVAGLFMQMLYKILEEIKSFEIQERLLIVGLIFSIPAIIGIAGTAKPDILGGFLSIYSCFMFIRFAKRRKLSDLLLCAISLILLLGTKYTYYLWGVLLLLCYVAISIILVAKGKRRGEHFFSIDVSVRHAIVLISSIFLIGGIIGRTIYLTGYPFYPMLLDVCNQLGFQARNFARNYDISIVNDRITSLVDIVRRYITTFFLPAEAAGNLQASWVSNIIFFAASLLISSLLISKKRKSSTKRICIVLCLVMAIAMGGCLLTNLLDGNYYLTPIVIMLIISAYMFRMAKPPLFLKRAATICACLFVLFQVGISHLTHISWHLGTRPFSGDVINISDDSMKANIELYKNAGIERIENYLSEGTHGKKRTIAVGDIQPYIAWRLSAGVEHVDELPGYLGNSGLFESMDTFIHYMHSANIHGVIVMNDSSDNAITEMFVDYLDMFGFITKIEDEKGSLYILQ